MWVVPAKGIVHCFSCGFSADAVGFLQHVEGVDFKEACRRLGAPDWKPAPNYQPETRPKPVERVTSKPPASAPTPSFKLRELGEPSHVYPLRDLDGSILGYECRYPAATGKEIRMWTWGARGSDPAEWGCGHFNNPRPLYGLPQLAERPGAPVSIFEGPKKADAGKRLLPPYACISWTGGASAWYKHDWTPLKGRNVLLWPDADMQKASAIQAEKLGIKDGEYLPYEEQPGVRAMLCLAALLSDPKGLGCSVKIIDVNRMPASWDIADAEAEGWDTFKLIEWAKPRARVYALPGAALESQPAPDPPQPERKRRRAQLAVVDGNTVKQVDAEHVPASMSEDALADYFAAQHGENWRYVKPWGAWFEWRGDGWYRDDTNKVDRVAVEITRQAIYWQEAQRMTDDGRRKINSKRTAGNLRDIACSDRRIAATVDQWDSDKWLLGVPGGVVDLGTGELLTPERGQYITKRAAVAPASGDAPIWREFLKTVTAGHTELIEFLQRFAGYALTGETREQCLAFLYGTGQNGKGVFITTLYRILGDYAVTADADVFMETDQQRHPTEMARLRGARLVTVDETDNAKRWNEKRIKRITGGGKMEARFMRQDDFEFEPQFKLLIAGNHKPQLRGVGKAIKRRLHLVPFTVTIPDYQRDDKLAEKLAEEYPQILQWMIEGCESWSAHGLRAPQEVVDATANYIEGEDVIGEWLEERCEQQGETERPIAYRNYKAWVEGRGERAWSGKAFWAALEERGFDLHKSHGKRLILGLSLRQTVPEEAPPAGRYPD